MAVKHDFDYTALLVSQQRLCPACNKREAKAPFIVPIVPYTDGGSTGISNHLALCGWCVRKLVSKEGATPRVSAVWPHIKARGERVVSMLPTVQKRVKFDAVPTETKLRALEDITVFADMIKFKGGMGKFGRVHGELLTHVTKLGGAEGTRKLILMPRGHLKSTICSVLRTLWRIYQNPNIRILVATSVKALAQAFIRELRTYLEDVELQASVWNNRPHVEGALIPTMERAGNRASRDKEGGEAEDKKVIWSTYAIQVVRSKPMKEPTVRAISVGSSLTGEHYDEILLDDLVDPKNVETDIKRERVLNWALDLQSIVDPWDDVAKCGDTIIVLGTRYHSDDLYSTLLDQDDYDLFFRNIYANGENFEDGTLWPERFTVAKLNKIKDEQRHNMRIWYAQYLNKIVQLEDAAIQGFRYFNANELTRRGDGWYLADGTDSIFLKPTIAVDWAFTANKRSDYTAIVCGAMNHDGTLFILDACLMKATSDKVFPKIVELATRWQVDRIGVEKTSAHEMIRSFRAHLLRHNKKFLVTEILAKGDKVARIHTNLVPLYGEGQVFHADSIRGGLLEDQLLEFPNAAKDDGPDAASMLVDLVKNSRAPKQQFTRNRSILERDQYHATSEGRRRFGGIR